LATDSIGGETYGIGTVETTFPLGLPEEFGLEGAVFADVGTLFNAPEQGQKPRTRRRCSPREGEGGGG
jgi:outer membrane protein insertion porin family